MSNQSSQGQRSDKRGTYNRLRESGSQREENIIPNGGYCCEAVKLDKVLSLFTAMKTVKKRVDQLEENNKKLEEAQMF